MRISRILLLPFLAIGAVVAAGVRLFRAFFRPIVWGVIGAGCLAIVVGITRNLERPPVQSVQRGYRGVGMNVVWNPDAVGKTMDMNRVLEPQPPVDPAGKPSSEAYENIKVLKTVDANEMLRLMAAMTSWVAPQVGCAYCHSVENLASDAVYTKTVARRMIQMVQYINSHYKSHVGDVGVTCYTCHRGQGIPSSTWFIAPQPEAAPGMVESVTGKNLPSAAADLTALPYDPFTPFLLEAKPIRVEGTTALAAQGNRSSIKQTDWTYALMAHFAESLGVGCTFCHDTRAFNNWDQSTPQRVTAWHGILMVRDLNVHYMESLRGVFPRASLGLRGDAPKINCATCHQGAYKPFYGGSDLSAYPALSGPTEASTGTAPNPPGAPPPSGAAPPAVGHP